MTEREAKGLAIGRQVHVERPGECRLLTITGHRTNGGVYAQGGPVRAYYGEALALLHFPHLCPYSKPA